MRSKTLLVLMFALALAGCQKAADEAESETAVETAIGEPAVAVREAPAVDPSRCDIYAPFTLTADLSHLSDGQKEMVGLLIEAAKIMDDLFWRQAYGDRDTLLPTIGDEK